MSSEKVKTLFMQALELEPELRAAFLDERCAGDAELRAAIEELLLCDAKAQSTPDFCGITMRSRPAAVVVMRGAAEKSKSGPSSSGQFGLT